MPEFKENNDGQNEINFSFDLEDTFDAPKSPSTSEVIAAAHAMAKRQEARMDILHSTIADFTGQEKPPLPDPSTRAVPYISKIESSYDTTVSGQSSLELENAKQLAEHHGTELAEVFSNDDLYKELQLATHTPDSFAETYIDTLNQMSGEEYERSRAIMIVESLLPKEGLSEDERSAIIMEFQQNPEIQAAAQKFANQSREAIRQSFVCEATQYWGNDVLERVAPETKEILTPTQPLALNIIERLNDL